MLRWGLVLLACGRGDTTVITPAPQSVVESPARGAAGTTATPTIAATPVEGASSASGASSGGVSAGGTSTVIAASGPTSTSLAPVSTDTLRRAVPGRLIAIGDLHGDAAVTRAALRLGGAIDDDGRWIGGNLTVVQTGDQLDRGDEEREILDLFTALAASATAHDGQVIALDGNHEVMNVQGDFRYVTPGGMAAFAGVSPRSPLARSVPAAFQERAAAFLPGGAYALELAKRDVVAVVGDSVFVHGGVLPDHVRYGVDRINLESRAWMRGDGSGPERRAPEAVAGPTAPVWVRDYSLDPVSPRTCEMLGQVLESLQVKRMVVGHTVQSQGISTACDDRVYRIDVGLSRYYGKNPVQVLEIDGAKIRVLGADRELGVGKRP
jgi:hypothetical protein